MALLFVGMAFTPLKAQQAAPAPASSTKAQAVKPVKAKAVNDEEGIKKLFVDFSQAWASGDAHQLASLWVKDGSLINPYGQEAWNREDVEKILGVDTQKMKGSTPAFSDFKFRFILNFALVDCTAIFSGLKKTNGTDASDLSFHIYSALAFRDGRWYILALRPYALAMPSQENAVAEPTSIPGVVGSVPALDVVKTPVASSTPVPTSILTPTSISIPSPDLPVPPGK
jgi:uncharacterized protein (TIGR02246 family)